jgi:hypothetical protein
MEFEISLLYSPEPASGFYPEPHESSPTTSLCISLRCILIVSSHVHLSLPRDLFPSGYRLEFCTDFSPPFHATYPAYLKV